MTDLREGRIQAFLDGEMDGSDRESLLEEMARDLSLAAAVERQKARIELVSAALDEAFEGDEAAEDIAAAWERISQAAAGAATAPRPRLVLEGSDVEEPRATTRRSSGPRRLPVSLAKAAALLLVATGVGAATVPGSPVRAWLSDWYGPERPTAGAPEGAALEPSGPEVVGLRLPATGDPVEVFVAGPLTAPLRVSLTDGTELEVVAETGTRFATSRGRIEVSGVQGTLEVRIPRSLAELRLTVGGETFLRKSGAQVEMLRAGVDTLPTAFVFAPAAESDPGR